MTIATATAPSARPQPDRVEVVRSVMVPAQTVDMGVLEDLAGLVQPTRGGGLWSGQSFRVDPVLAYANLLGRGISIPLGLAVGLVPLRTAYDAALQIRSLLALGATSIAFAYGSGDLSFGSAIGNPLARPATDTAQYVTDVRTLVRRESPADDRLRAMHASLGPLPDRSRTRIGAGVLRPRLARMVREIDFITTWLASPRYIDQHLRPALSEGTEHAPSIVAVVPFAVRRPGRSPQILARAAAGRHLQLEHYRDVLRRTGVDLEATGLTAVHKQLIDHKIFLYGTPAEIRESIVEYAAAGVTEIVLQASAVASAIGIADALQDLEDVLDA